MSEFEKQYGEPLIIQEGHTVTYEAITAALAEVGLETKEGDQVVLVDSKDNIIRRGSDGSFAVVPKRDYVIMRLTEKDINAMIKKKEESDRKEAERQARANAAVASFNKRDMLRDIEKKVQSKWEAEKVFELDAPTTPEGRQQAKYFATFPYPYMNGRLHIGHTFTLSKAEFAVGYERLKGKNAFFPFGFHCTGMPIKAASDKLKYEMATFGTPPVFPIAPESVQIKIYAHDPEKKKKKAGSRKSKAAAKTGNAKWQWDIMKNSDIQDADIVRFSDPVHWVKYFPPHVTSDLKAMGLKVDWRRSFVTTDINPYYDSFVRWQFERLREAGKIKFGKRNTIYSPKDQGACMDHDRQSGEGITPTAFTCVKQLLLKPYPPALASLEGIGKKVYLIPATLRPETMYGQTNCWVLPTGDYGAFEHENDIIICTERAARNISYQYEDSENPRWGKVVQLLTFTGEDLIGAALEAPLTSYNKIYVLPMLSVLTNKGTGVVTSVPSDSPDDYTALRDLKQKPDLRKKYGVKDEMVLDFPIIPIINIPGLGDVAAETVVEQMKIKSQNDRALLDKAKDEVYTKGFYSGTLIVGPYAGSKVEDVKAKIRDELIAEGKAFNYAEPGGEVISRSGDECVVALIDQWYLDYGEVNWRELAEKCLATMETYSPEVRQMFVTGFRELTQWACSRSFGLGTRLPWDEVYLIDSLSDSTIYMAYYTVAHILHSDLEGKIPGVGGFPASAMTPAVWDYVFLGKPLTTPTSIADATLKLMRDEFTYWYPVDLRVSGKDLVPNHLLFWIYNHCALFDESKWPRSVRANGHIMLNSAKMSKSTGNFISLITAVERYSADGMRFALADAGDSVTDANFTTEAADGVLLKLFTQLEWIEDVLKVKDTYRTGELNFQDLIFQSRINLAIDLTDKAYARMEYKEAAKTGFFDLQTARDNYQEVLKIQNVAMHKDLVEQFIRVQTLLLCPICPHWAEWTWTEHLKEPKSIMYAKFPVGGLIDHLKLYQSTHLEQQIHNWRIRLAAYMKPKKGPAQQRPEKCTIICARNYPVYQDVSIQILEKLFKEKNSLPDQATLLQELRNDSRLTDVKKAMTFARGLCDAYAERGNAIFDRNLSFDECVFFQDNIVYISKSLGIGDVTIVWSDAPGVPADVAAIAVPTTPAITFSA